MMAASANDSGVEETSNDSNSNDIINPAALAAAAINLPPPLLIANNNDYHHLPSLSGFVLPKAVAASSNFECRILSSTSSTNRAGDDDPTPTSRRNFNHVHCLPSSSHSLKLRSHYSSCNKTRYKAAIPHVLILSRERKLRVAASTCNIDLLCRLLESNTNPNSSDEHKRSPLHLAACRGYTDIVTQLLKYGANPNIVDSLGNTPLHLAVISACSNNFNLVIRILLQNGANVHLVDRTGKNPLELAESKLILMRSRYQNPTKEMLKSLEDLCILIALILRHFCKQKNDIDDITALQERLEKLNTNEQVVTEVDCLLASVERLSLNK